MGQTGPKTPSATTHSLFTAYLISREPTIPMLILIHDAVEHLKASSNLVVGEERVLDNPDGPNRGDNGSNWLLYTSRSGQPDLF
jgi:hypothetical protein